MIIQLLIDSMNNLNPLVIKGLMFIFTMSVIVLIAKFSGKEGLFIYGVLAIIIANIQVLKAVEIEFFKYAMPLGNIIFTSIFFVNDIITEIYGSKEAKKAVCLGFIFTLIFNIIMILTIGIKPLNNPVDSHQHFNEAHNSMVVLFTPSLSILSASLIAYFVSSYMDISIFNSLKLITKDNFLWLRTLISTFCSIIVDNILFSLLAWVLFSVRNIEFSVVFNSYILTTLMIRLFLTITTIPVFYLLKKLVKNNLGDSLSAG